MQLCTLRSCAVCWPQPKPALCCCLPKAETFDTKATVRERGGWHAEEMSSQELPQGSPQRPHKNAQPYLNCFFPVGCPAFLLSLQPWVVNAAGVKNAGADLVRPTDTDSPQGLLQTRTCTAAGEFALARPCQQWSHSRRCGAPWLGAIDWCSALNSPLICQTASSVCRDLP